MTYSEKLRDPRWQKKRLQILERDNWTCRDCTAKDKPLHVHHAVYRRIDPWEYPDELYVTLCDSCHQTRQELTDKTVDAFRIRLKSIPTSRLEKIARKMMDGAMDEMEGCV